MKSELENGRQSTKGYWLVVLIISIALISAIGTMWYTVDSNYEPNQNQVTTEQQAINDYRAKLPERAKQGELSKLVVPTGIYLQSLNFTSANDVYIMGTLWQTFPSDLVITSPKLYFPEQVNGMMSPVLKYKKHIEDKIVYGWAFEVTVRQPFDYRMYPLDHKTVWLRILPDDIANNVILVPDLTSYPSTENGDAFGLDDQIVLGNWEVNETFFDYKLNHYKTNFGFMSDTDNRIPELHFNVVVKRKVVNAFVVHLVPMVTVAVLLFAILLNFSHNPTLASANGFSRMGVVGSISALFFIVVISHVDIRTQFQSQGLIYIECFYLIMYLMMTWVVVSSFIDYDESRWYCRVLENDSLMIKLMYWPLVLGAISIMTYWVLF